MACRLVALDKRLGVRPIGIGETICQSITKLVMRAAGYQENTACRSLQLCAGLGAGIEGETHAVAQRWRERIALVPEGRAEEESDDGIRMAADNVYRDGDVPTVGGVGEVPVPPREMQVIEDGVGGERDKLRTVMEEMVVG